MGGDGGLVLGISADYHDSAAALVSDGTVVAAAEEERFSRRKHDPRLPAMAVEWCLRDAGADVADLEAVAFYGKPVTTYERILLTNARSGPRAVGNLARAVPTWSWSKLWIRYRIERLLRGIGPTASRHLPPVLFAEHHQSHAASAFLPSPFERAAVITVDGVGEWTTTSIGHGAGNRVDLLRELRFPDSLGLLYSAVTGFLGFEVNDGEYKVMGLAPYGEPRLADVIRTRLVRSSEDGSIALDRHVFGDHSDARRMNERLADLLGVPARAPGERLEQVHADVARSVQEVLEERVLAIAEEAHRLTGERDLCLAGGVALNCVANARLERDGPFDRIWVQPAAGDGGGALGAALWAWHQLPDRPRAPAVPDGMSGAALGPAFPADAVARWLDGNGITSRRFTDPAQLDRVVAAALAEGAVVGWFQGRMEYGPRALGHRSILADPRAAEVVSRVNLAVKGREGFRPLAPAVLAEHASEWFDLDGDHPYMTVTVPVRGADLVGASRGAATGSRPTASDPTASDPTDFAGRLAGSRSPIPACTHVDGSARVQTVDVQRHPRFHDLLRAFHELTGCPVLLNTSFNGSGEPIVCTPADAYRTFAATGLDLLVIEDSLVGRDAVEGPGAPPCC